MLASNSETIGISGIVPERTGEIYVIETKIKVVIIFAKTSITAGRLPGAPLLCYIRFKYLAMKLLSESEKLVIIIYLTTFLKRPEYDWTVGYGIVYSNKL